MPIVVKSDFDLGDLTYSYTNGIGQVLEADFLPGTAVFAKVGAETFVLSHSGSGLGVFRLDADGTLNLLDVYATNLKVSDGFSGFSGVSFIAIEGATEAVVYSVGYHVLTSPNYRVTHEEGVVTWTLDASGVLSHRSSYFHPENDGTITPRDAQFYEISGVPFLVAATNPVDVPPDGGTFTSYFLDGSGAVSGELDNSVAKSGIWDSMSVLRDGKYYHITKSLIGDLITSFEVSANGALSVSGKVRAGEFGLGDGRFGAIECVTIGRKIFVFSTNRDGDVFVYEHTPDGNFKLVEVERPTKNTDSWFSPIDLDVFVIGGRTFLASASIGENSEPAIGAIFEISDRGALTEVEEFPLVSFQPDSFWNTTAFNWSVLPGVNHATFIAWGEGQNFLHGDLVSFQYTPDDTAITGTARDNKRIGGTGDDQIFGLAGEDDLRGKQGDDLIEGGTGDDIIRGGIGNDHLSGNGGDDLILGDHGDDFIFGGGDNDLLYGRRGTDFIYGETGNDSVVGNGGDDWLWGGSGNDKIVGGGGNDVIHDGQGNDVMIGGDFYDTFVLTPDGEMDRIEDFEFLRDHIDLSAFGPSLYFSDIRQTYINDKIVVRFLDELLVLRPDDPNIVNPELRANDFIFA